MPQIRYHHYQPGDRVRITTAYGSHAPNSIGRVHQVYWAAHLCAITIEESQRTIIIPSHLLEHISQMRAVGESA